jgi:hypothetical protein
MDHKIRFIGSPENRYAAYKYQFCVISFDGLRIFPKADREANFFAMPAKTPSCSARDRFLLAMISEKII